MSGDVIMRDARSGGAPPGDRERDREGRDVVMRDSFRGERGMERADPLREVRDSREMRERDLMRMERDRDRMERERMDRAERERDMRDSSMMRERRFLDRTPSGMERDPRGLESPAALGGRDREREREQERESIGEIKKVKTEQPPTPGGLGVSSPGKDKDGRKGGGGK